MKKDYEKPMAEIIEFVSEEPIMNDVIDPDDDYVDGSGFIEEW